VEGLFSEVRLQGIGPSVKDRYDDELMALARIPTQSEWDKPHGTEKPF
jgi:hypothetical protein